LDNHAQQATIVLGAVTRFLLSIITSLTVDTQNALESSVRKLLTWPIF